MVFGKGAEEIGMDTMVQRDPEQQFSTIDDEIVMLSLKEGQYYALNTVAARIWIIIENPVSVTELVDSLLSEFDVDQNECIEDTLECLRDFKEKSLLK